MANPAQTATVEHGAPGGEAVAFGFIDPGMFIAIAMIAVIILIVWKKVPAAIGKALDGKIDAIRKQLAEAETLRKDAEGLKAEYQAKAAEAAAEAKAMIERARHEADAMLAKAKVDSEVLVERRSRMAEEKIAAEERSAIEQLRATAADAARKAAGQMIAEGMDQKTDKALVDQAIGGLGR